jgi:hypothetical protein
MRNYARTRNHLLQNQWVCEQYEKAGMPTPATSREIAAWALQKGLVKPKERDIIGEIADDIARAQREVYRIDAKGRRYRAKHAVRTNVAGVAFARWGDIDRDAPDFIRKSLSQKRRHVAGECYWLKVDTDHFNELYAGTPDQMELDLNFTNDVAERQLLEDDQSTAA